MAVAAIDGDAGTVITKWDGDPASLDWVQYDVTSLPYRIRRGEVGVIGVGGGRDVLTAICGGQHVASPASRSTRRLIDVLQGRYREFARIADHPGRDARPRRSAIVSDAVARQVSTSCRCRSSTPGRRPAPAPSRCPRTGSTRATAGRCFCARSRRRASSASRAGSIPRPRRRPRACSSLGVASLLDFGVTAPRRHLILVTRERIATLLVSPTPFSDEDGATRAPHRRRARLHGSRDAVERRRRRSVARHRRSPHRPRTSIGATRDPYFDFTRAHRRPAVLLQHAQAARVLLPSRPRRAAGSSAGICVATRTLLALAVRRRRPGAGDHRVAARGGRPAAHAAECVRGSPRVLRASSGSRSCWSRLRFSNASRSTSAIRRTPSRSSCS